MPKLLCFSEIGDEAILSTLWGRYNDALDKVFICVCVCVCIVMLYYEE